MAVRAFDLLASTGTELLDCEDINACLRSFYGRLADLLQLDLFLHYELLPQETQLRLLVASGVPEDRQPALMRLELGETVCGAVGHSGEPAVLNSVQRTSDPRTALIRRVGITAYACYPLGHRGRVIGTLSFGSRRFDAYAEETLAVLRAVSAQVAMVIHRRRTESALRHSERTLREADKRKDEFLAVLAHELRYPLAPIRSGLDLLRLGTASAEARLCATEMMNRQLGHIVRLVDDLLDASRIKTGKQ